MNILDKKTKKVLSIPTYNWEIFYKKTHNKKGDVKELEQYPKEWITIYSKAYSRLPEIRLPKPKKINTSMIKTLEDRISSREFSSKKIPIDVLSTLLFYSVGIKKTSALNPEGDKRFYPSGGGRYPIETYIFAFNIEGLDKGIYHYYGKNHSLEQIHLFESFNHDEYFTLPWINKASCIIVLSSIFERNTVKYGDRGYNLCFIEAGHIGQNIYLMSEALKLKCCAVGGFFEDSLNKLLNFKQKESVLYTLALGK